MKRYLVRRILFVIPMFLLMTLTYFSLQNMLPGGPVQEALARIRGLGEGGGNLSPSSHSDGSRSPEELQKLTYELQVQYGLDKPVLTRYALWLKNIVTFNFGISTTTRQSAFKQIVDCLPVSLAFGIPSFFLTYLVCIPLGVLLALKEGSRFDSTISFLLFVAYSIPALVFALIFLLVFCTDRVLPYGALFPLGGLHSDHFETLSLWQKVLDLGHHLFLPVLSSMIGQFTVLTFLQKNSMLDVIRADYVRTARAKGLPEKTVIFKHALRNALLPMMVGFGSVLGIFLGGSLIIEPIFGLQGIGMLSLQSLASRDFNVVMGIAVLQSLAILFGRLLSDIAYAVVDPRIEYH